MSAPDKEKIPLLKSWRQWYWLVIGFLALLIVLFYLFTKHYA
jgi:bacteriorhodopsin